MNYFDFGNTGEKISALGFGCMRFPEDRSGETVTVDQEKVDEMLLCAHQCGVNYFDTAPYYCNHGGEAALGHAVKPFRSQVLLSTKCPLSKVKKAGDYRAQIEESLRRLDTDYIDFYHFWSLDRETFDEQVIPMGLLEEAARAKEEGLIRHISFSFHDHPSAIRHIIDTAEAHGVPMESMLCQYNLIDRSNEEMIRYAKEKGLGTVAMGPGGGGRLAAPTELYTKLTGKPSIATYELALRFCLGNPYLDCALSGMQTVDMVRQNADIASDDTAFSEKEWEQMGAAMEQLRRFSDLYCTGCQYCLPCPAEINIPRIFEMWTYYNVYGLTDHAKGMMRGYLAKDGKTPADCLGCGLCEQKCPQRLSVREHLARVVKTLSE